MIEHSLDLPLAVIVVLMLVDKGIAWSRYLVSRTNGVAKARANGYVTRADLLAVKEDLLKAMRDGQDKLHARITDIGERLARLEGRP